MAQNRDAPAFQEYAASMMARTEYRVMTLAERGLLYALRLECWVNRRVPANPATLARILGFDRAEVEAALNGVMPFFAITDGHIVSPELEGYREHLDGIRERQSQGGKQGAAKTNSKQGKPHVLDGPGDSTGDPRLTCDSLVKSSSVKSNSIQVLTVKHLEDEWVSDYNQASNGH